VVQGLAPALAPKRTLLVAVTQQQHTEQKNKVETGRGSRVVNRSNNNANPNGGVAYVNSNNDPSNTNANIGTRLAHRRTSSAVVSQDEKDAGQRLCITKRPAACRASLNHPCLMEVENHDALGHSGE